MVKKPLLIFLVVAILALIGFYEARQQYRQGNRQAKAYLDMSIREKAQERFRLIAAYVAIQARNNGNTFPASLNLNGKVQIENSEAITLRELLTDPATWKSSLYRPVTQSAEPIKYCPASTPRGQPCKADRFILWSPEASYDGKRLIMMNDLAIEFVSDNQLSFSDQTIRQVPASVPSATQPVKEKTVGQGPPDTAFSDNPAEAVKKDADRNPSLGRIAIRSRIDKHIDKLRSEDTRASLRNLSQAEMFIWPGYPTGAFGGNMTLPLPRGIESGRTETILSNRRFLKVLKELSERSPSEASRMVREEIEATLPVYRKMFETTWKHVLETRRLHPLGKEGGTVGPSLRLSDNPDGSPTLFGICYKLQSLVLVAGNLGLDEARSAIWTTVDEAMKQRDRFYRGGGEEPDRFAMLDRIGIYNRQILATGIIGTRPGRQNRSLATEASDKTQWETRELTLYDAAMTPYDIPVRHRVLPVDYSKGKQTVHYYRMADDKDFDVILKTYRPK